METANKQLAKRRRLSGVVVSDKMTKTVAVSVVRTIVHPKYGKRYIKGTKYLAHNEGDEAKTGDEVTIEETRPLSSRKRWRVVSINKKASVV
ncbi:MAG: small subunit ribosomal protein [Patescibacteria group bacterium]|jgi:small subunit ribosomal protein S17|nr:small subunit ribosomal protein [Patescibacteria group bacterium]